MKFHLETRNGGVLCCGNATAQLLARSPDLGRVDCLRCLRYLRGLAEGANPRAHPCSYCGVQPGDDCRSGRGYIMGSFHVNRRVAIGGCFANAAKVVDYLSQNPPYRDT